jgi:endonuclease/exonuclease/phosphatase family metal-dependent hydrolase
MLTIRRNLLSALLAAAAVLPAFAATPVTVTVMTRNMYFGANLDPILAATDVASLAQGTAAVYDQIQKTGFAARAAKVADEIAAGRPDLVALQEVSLWRTGPLLSPPATDVLYDQLDLLLSALAQRKLHYGVIAMQHLVDAEAPVPTANIDLRLTDRDVILANLDLPQAVFDWTNAQTHRYQAIFGIGSPVLGQFTMPRGWLSVDIVMQGVKFRLAATHLESTYPGIPDGQKAQEAQAAELAASLAGLDVPVIVIGDFNSNAEPGPEQTASLRTFLLAGFADAWRSAHPGDPGLTWPVVAEDSGSPATPLERIDLVLTRALQPTFFSPGLRVLSAERTATESGATASDHAGVVVRLQLQ